MPLYQAIILALVQALTEFLPISSTAHLIIFPWLAGWQDPGLAFDVALHAGTLLALVLYFFKDWLTLLLCGLGMKYPATAPAEDIAHHRNGPLSPPDTGGRNAVLVHPVGASDCRSRGDGVAKTHQDAQSRRPRLAALHPGHQRPRFRHCRLFCHRFFPALPANTHFESICCLSPGVWYHHPGLGVPPGGIAIAPAPAATLSLPQKLRRCRALSYSD